MTSLRRVIAGKPKHIIELNEILKNTKGSELEKINRSLSDFHNSKLLCSSTRSSAEIEDIKLAVDEMVDRLIATFGDYGDSRQFEVSHKYLVGSMAEGTRITEPNEFDFIVVLKELSKPGALKVKLIDNVKDCSDHFEMKEHALKHVHVKVKDSNLRKLYKWEILDDGYLKTIITLQEHMEVLRAAIEKNITYEIVKDTGRLSVLDTVAPNGPAGTFSLQWMPQNTLESNPFLINVDTVLAIEISKTFAKKEDASVPKYFKLLKDDKSCLILPAGLHDIHGQRCFKCSFARTEVKLMKSLSEYHKACYRLMKHIVVQGEEKIDRYISTAFPSYLIKTVVLKHSARCEKDNILSCIVDIIKQMSKICHHFDRIHNHFAETTLFFKENFVSEAPYEEEQILGYLEGLTEIVKQKVSELK